MTELSEAWADALGAFERHLAHERDLSEHSVRA
ncbi:MAG: recombinase XerC, partial [Actinomycetales bacterium]